MLINRIGKEPSPDLNKGMSSNIYFLGHFFSLPMFWSLRYVFLVLNKGMNFLNLFSHTINMKTNENSQGKGKNEVEA